MGGHETVEPCPSVSSYRQKFMHLRLGPKPARTDCSKGERERGADGKGTDGIHKAARPREVWRPTGVGAPFMRRRTVRYKRIPRVAVRVEPLYVAEIVAEVEMRTTDVLTVKVAVVAPGGTVTLAGTLAAPLLLERKT